MTAHVHIWVPIDVRNPQIRKWLLGGGAPSLTAMKLFGNDAELSMKLVTHIFPLDLAALVATSRDLIWALRPRAGRCGLTEQRIRECCRDYIGRAGARLGFAPPWLLGSSR